MNRTKNFLPGNVVSLETRFADFHAANPAIYSTLVEMTRRWKQAGHKTASIAMFFEILRWERGMTTATLDFKLSNSYRAPYSRLIEAEYPELRGMFTLRTSKFDNIYGSAEDFAATNVTVSA